MRYLTPTERDRLVELAKKHTTGELALILGRNRSSIKRALDRMGIKPHPPRYRPNAGNFQKGQRPSPATEFQPGHPSQWVKPEGTVTVLKNGYVVAKDGGKWKPLAQVHPELNQTIKALHQLNQAIHERTAKSPANPVQ